MTYETLQNQLANSLARSALSFMRRKCLPEKEALMEAWMSHAIDSSFIYQNAVNHPEFNERAVTNMAQLEIKTILSEN